MALAGTVASAFGTCDIAAGLSAAAYTASRGEGLPADLRPTHSRPATILALLAVLWAVSAAGLLPATANQVLTATCLVAVAWHLSRPVGAAAVTDAVGSLVLELGPTGRPASPLSASLARALADPDYQVRSYQPGTGWTDELGKSVPDPVTAERGSTLTVVEAPAGGRWCWSMGRAVPGTRNWFGPRRVQLRWR